MLVSNALSLLKPYARVEADNGRYRATVEATGGTITFDGQAGHVAKLRLSREGQREWVPRSVTAALRHALERGRTFPTTLESGRDLLLSVSIDRRGRKLAPMACFMAIDLSDGPTHLQGAADEWSDDEAVRVVAEAIDGTTEVATLVSWLVGRGGQVAELLRGRSRGC